MGKPKGNGTGQNDLGRKEKGIPVDRQIENLFSKVGWRLIEGSDEPINSEQAFIEWINEDDLSGIIRDEKKLGQGERCRFLEFGRDFEWRRLRVTEPSRCLEL
jgi:hypothetical protein